MERRNNIIVMVVLSVICLIMITASTINDRWISPVRNVVGFLLTPVQGSVNKLAAAISDAVEGHQDIVSLTDENSELKNTVDELIAENTRLQLNQLELERLRNLYTLDTEYAQYNKTAARVIAKDAADWFNVFRIDKGTDDGIRVDMNVLAGNGLVGIVTETGNSYATVRSIIDDSSRISAMSVSGGDTAMVCGSVSEYNSGRIILNDIKNDAVITEGDKIVTSNISSKYLPGILIGYVSDVSVDSNMLTQSGYLIPAADFTSLQEVLIITDLKE